MNWKQLHTSATTEEQIEAITLMFKTIETRQSDLIVVQGRLIRNRRGAFRGAHFLHDRRVHPSPHMTGILLIAAVINLGIWILALPYAPQVAPPVVTAHLVGLGLLFAFHPMPAPRTQVTA